MNQLNQHQQQVIERARGVWKTQRELKTSRGTINTLLALGKLRRKLVTGKKHTATPELGSVYKAVE